MEYKVQDDIATLSFNSPSTLNALTLATYTEFIKLMKNAVSSPGVKAIIITGKGRFFSSGASVNTKDDSSPVPGSSTDSSDPLALHSRFRNSIIPMSLSLAQCPKLTVVALNGPAVGYAAGFIGHADLIFAAESAWLHPLFTQLAISPEGGSSYMFPKRMGYSKAIESLLLSKKMYASELASCGFVNQVFPDKDFHFTVHENVKSVVSNVSINSLMAAKRMLKASFEREQVLNIHAEVDQLVARFDGGEPQRVFAALAAKHSGKNSKL